MIRAKPANMDESYLACGIAAPVNVLMIGVVALGVVTAGGGVVVAAGHLPSAGSGDPSGHSAGGAGVVAGGGDGTGAQVETGGAGAGVVTCGTLDQTLHVDSGTGAVVVSLDGVELHCCH